VLPKRLGLLLEGAIQCVKLRRPELLKNQPHNWKEQTADDFAVMEYDAKLIVQLNGEVVISPEHSAA